MEKLTNAEDIVTSLRSDDNKIRVIFLAPEDKEALTAINPRIGKNLKDDLRKRNMTTVVRSRSNPERKIRVQVIPVMEKSKPEVDRDTELELGMAKTDAIYEIFDRWTRTGQNQRQIRNIIEGPEFFRYLQDIGYSGADYVVIGWIFEGGRS